MEKFNATRWLAGTLLAPLILIPGLPLLLALAQLQATGTVDPDSLLAVLPNGLVLGYMAAILFSLPAYLLLGPLGRRPVVAVLAAAVVGFLAAILVQRVHEAIVSPATLIDSIDTLLAEPTLLFNYSTYSGLLGGLAFWAIARPGKA